MSLPLMPKATAVWLVEHTGLSFEQIAKFCGLHVLEVKGIADGEVAVGILGLDPVANNQLTLEEIRRCEEDNRSSLKMVRTDLPQPVVRTKGPRYTPVSKRADKPDAVAYLVKTHPELLDAQIARLLGTTKDTIAKVRNRSHWNAANIKPRNPVLLGLCKQTDLDLAVSRAQRRVARQMKEGGLTPQEQQEMQEDATFPEIEEEVENENMVNLEGGEGEEQPDIDPETMFRNIG